MADGTSYHLAVDREILISVDLETGGPAPGLYPLLSIGACLVEDDTQLFYRELKPEPAGRYIPEAVQVGFPDRPAAETIARLKEEGVSPLRVAVELDRWVRDMAAGGEPVFVGFNAAFDWAFIVYLFAEAGLDNPFGHAPFDVKAFWAGRAGVPFARTSKSKLPAELTEGLPPHSHRADEDAVRQALVLQRMFELMDRPDVRDRFGG